MRSNTDSRGVCYRHLKERHSLEVWDAYYLNEANYCNWNSWTIVCTRLYSKVSGRSYVENRNNIIVDI